MNWIEKDKLRIIFMGTPQFAVASLDAILQAGYNVVAVITAPDKPAGRGMELQQSAVKKYALENNLLVLQPEKLKSAVFINELKNFKAHLQVCVAFRMLPYIVWNMPEMGTINLHGSLLPQYRGAAPINWAIINGETETGVTTFKLQHDIDTGNILLQEKFPISDDDTAGIIHDKMMHIGAKVLVNTIDGLVSNTLIEEKQQIPENKTLHTAPKIFTETCLIDTNRPLEEVYNLVRGLSPYPTAFSFLNGKKLKIFKADKINKQPSIQSGLFETDGKTHLHLACANGYLQLYDIQLEGKKRMLVQDFLRGYRV